MFPQDPFTRRNFLTQTGLGLGGLALADMMASESPAAEPAVGSCGRSWCAGQATLRAARETCDLLVHVGRAFTARSV